jgi:hypothetical protein
VFIDTQAILVRMVIDLESMEVMEFIGNKMGVAIKVTAKAGERYSIRGGEAVSIVPPGYCHIEIDPKKARINDFWEKVRAEKTKRRAAWLLANPIIPS